MQCHYCDDEAAIAVEKDHLKVGVCEEHLRERLEDLPESEWLETIQSQLDETLDS